MNTDRSVPRQTSILVLDAGELNIAVLRSLAGQSAPLLHLILSVLLRPKWKAA